MNRISKEPDIKVAEYRYPARLSGLFLFFNPASGLILVSDSAARKISGKIGYIIKYCHHLSKVCRQLLNIFPRLAPAKKNKII